jgi:crotonobetainyl-CoA:carnitine CoA-transferase CaiB-like acyl-CoA transferase
LKGEGETSDASIRRVSSFRLLTGACGPWCTKLLNDLGMEVIKVERYPYGDMTRYLFMYFEKEGKNLSSYYLNLNRGKKSICVNLRREKVKKLFISSREM